MSLYNNSNFGCYIQIVNTTDYPMTLQGTPYAGHTNVYNPGPAQTIPAQTASGPGMTGFYIENTSSTEGTEGSCTYNFPNSNNNITFAYACPFSGVNSFDVSININGTSGPVGEGLCQVIPNPLPQHGRPVYVQFTILSTMS